MGNGKKVFAACAIGGGAGAFLGHQLFYPSGWSLLLGFLFGGLVSYLAYDFKGFLTAIPQVWRETVDEIGNLVPVFAIAAIVASNTLVVIGVGVLNFSAETTDFLRSMLAIILVAGMMTNIFRIIIEDEKSNVQNSLQTKSISVIKWLNPFTNLFVGVPYLIFVIGKGVVFLLALLPRFIWNVFVLIHSELRLLCLLDGGLGAVVGTLIASTLAGMLVGALAGGIFGVLNFEIVSKRILKLVPSK